MTLTQKQIQKFHNDGFLLIENFADSKLCEEILQKAKQHIQTLNEPIESEEEYLNTNTTNPTLRRLRQVYDRENIFKEWMENKEIRPVLKQLLGETPVLTLAHHNSIMTKMPHISSNTCWHQDKRYWNFQDDNLLSVWLALGDEYLENGLLEFIPKSHNQEFTKDQFDDRTGFKEDLEKNKEIIKNRVHFNLKKGDIVLFHCKTLHYADKNNTDTPKISFVYTVKGINTKPVEGSRSDFKEVVLD